jgi:hypothetical protein
MSEDSQIVVPEAFVDLFRPPGADRNRRPLESREVIAARHEFCEDFAQMLVETARDKLFALGITEADVLDRIRRGLLEPGSPVSAPEAGWVTGRLAEVLGWPVPEDLRPAGAAPALARERGNNSESRE